MNSSVERALSSRYVLFSVEGSAEGVIIERLVEDDCLVISRNRIVPDANYYERPYTRTRKASDIAAQYFGVNYAVNGSEGLLIARIVDSRAANFNLPRNVRNAAVVYSFFTRPEIEMLAIFREGAYKDWLRAKRRNKDLRPCEFCKGELGLEKIKETTFLKKYWAKGDELAKSIREYARNCHRDKGENILADLLKE